MAYLVLVRHGQSEWNALGLWTGITDIGLTEQGRKEAQKVAEILEGINIQSAHVSRLKRAKETLAEIKKALKLSHIPTTEHEALNERHYGEYTGKNKWDLKKTLDKKTYSNIRRGWDHPISGGESLKDVHARVIPYYKKVILKDLKNGKNVIVAAHGNSLRALIKHLDNLSDKEITTFELATGEVHIYLLNENGRVISKEIRGNVAP